MRANHFNARYNINSKETQRIIEYINKVFLIGEAVLLNGQHTHFQNQRSIVPIPVEAQFRQYDRDSTVFWQAERSKVPLWTGI